MDYYGLKLVVLRASSAWKAKARGIQQYSSYKGEYGFHYALFQLCFKLRPVISCETSKLFIVS